MRTIRDLDVEGKKVLMRVDFNVPLKDNKVLDETRIREAMRSIKYLLERNARLILISHLGRPRGWDERLSLNPVYDVLKKYIKASFIGDCIGNKVENAANKIKPGEALLLENLRFYKEEEDNDAIFAKKLAKLADLYVNDAFGASHRAHASLHAITEFLPGAIGFLMEKEISELSKVLRPKKPFVFLSGGLKVTDKLELIKNFHADVILIGGLMACSFLKAKGYGVGKSMIDGVDTAKDILDSGKKIILPIDVIAETAGKPKLFKVNKVPEKAVILDIGPETCNLFEKELRKAQTIFWNGPMGKYEDEMYAEGTIKMARAIAKLKCIRIVGGGDSIETIGKLKLWDKFTHVSTGGGASLEFLSGKKLAALEALEKSRLKPILQVA